FSARRFLFCFRIFSWPVGEALASGENIPWDERVGLPAHSGRTQGPRSLSSPGLTGRPSIPVTVVFKRWASGILDRPLSRAMTAEMMREIVPAARFASGLCSVVVPQETEGAGNAGRWPHPQPGVGKGRNHTSIVTEGWPKRSGTPCAMVERLLRDLPGVPGLLATVVCGFVICRLDPSVGGSGPHGLTARADHRSPAIPARPSHPAPRFVTMAKRLFGERGTGGIKPLFLSFLK